MSPAETRTELDRFVVLGLKDGFVVSGQTPVLRDLGDNLRWVGTPRSGGTGTARSQDAGVFSSLDEYRSLLRAGDHLVVLADGSLVQASYTFRRDNLIRHRLAFYPCPVLFDVDELVIASLDEIVDERLRLAAETILNEPTEERESIRLRAAIRFDYERDPAPEHPSCHAHVAEDECRIPVFGPLSPGHFFHLVLRHFSPSLWATAPRELRDWAIRDLGRSIRYPEETSYLHFGWQAVVHDGDAA